MVRASGIRGYLAVMHELGADPFPLLRRCHINPKSLDDDDALLPIPSTVALLELSSEATGCADLGLRISRHQDISILGPLGVVLQNAATPQDALRLASRYLFIHSPGLVLTVHTPSALIEHAFEVSIEVRLPGQAQRQTIDLSLATTWTITKLLMEPGSHGFLKAVTLPHTPVAPLSIYRRHFGVPVIANQPRAGLHYDVAGLTGAMRGQNPALKQITEDYLARHFRVPGDSVGERVRLALRRMLGTPRSSKSDIAAMLAIHPRTLHRRLEAEGTGFETIKEELRKELALQYLRETKMPLGQLSGLLGFPEQSAFSRSCRRWFGVAPSALRRSRT